MAGYQRQSAADIVPTAVVRAAPINNEYNALRDAFLLASGHKHDGSATEGAYVPLIADADAMNKVVVDTTNNRLGAFVEVGGVAVEQVRVQDGAIVPVTTNDVDLGTSSLKFKDIYLSGAANFSTLTATTADINGGTIDATVIGATTPAAASVTSLTSSGTTTLNGTTIPASKTLVVTTDKLSVHAATTSAELAGVISDETGTGALVFANTPTLVTPILGTPTSGTLTNATGLPLTSGVTGTLPVANGGTGITSIGAGVATFLGTPTSANLAAAVTNETGTGSLVFATSPTLVTPILGTPTSGTLTNATGLPLTSGVTGTLPVANGGTGITSIGAGVATFLGTPTSANLAAAVTDETGTGALVFANTPTFVTPILGTPQSATLTNATGLPIGSGVSGLGANVSTFLATPTSANLAAAVTNETGSGSLVFATSPTLVTPILGTPTSGTMTNVTGLPLTTAVTGTLPIANGGTNATTVSTARANLLPTYATNAGKVLAVNAGATDVEYIAISGSGTVTSVDISVPSFLSVANNPITSAGTLALSYSGTAIPIANGGTNATTASGARTSLGATTVGSNLFTLTNVAAISFPRFNADNTVSTLDAASFRTAIGASTGTVTSVDVSGGSTGLTTSGGPVTGSGTITLAGTLAVANGGTGVTTAQAEMNRVAAAVTSGSYLRGNGTNVVMSTIQAADVPTLNQNTTGTAGGLSATLAISSGGTGATTLAGASIPTYSSTDTLTNKRITARVNPQTTTASPWNWDSTSYDQQEFTALANALTISLDASTTITDGQKTILRFQDNGTTRTLTFTGGASKGFRPIGVSMTISGSNFTYATAPGKTTYFACIYNSGDARWDIVAIAQEA